MPGLQRELRDPSALLLEERIGKNEERRGSFAADVVELIVETRGVVSLVHLDPLGNSQWRFRGDPHHDPVNFRKHG